MTIESLSYGLMSFTIVSTNEWLMENIFDEMVGADYLYTRYLIDVNLLWNPSEGAFTLQVAGDGVTDIKVVPANVGDTGGESITPARTEQAVRNYLEGQRRSLIIKQNTTIILQSPRLDDRNANRVSLPCDAKNGPFVKVRSVKHNTGANLWVVRVVFETFLNNTPSLYTSATGTPPTYQPRPVVLSHRWRVTDDVDGVTRLAVRNIEGVAVFNVGEMLYQGISADQLRAQLMVNVPDYFYRDNLKVNVEADGSTVRYVATDRERAYSINKASTARQIKLYDSAWQQNGGVGRVANSGAPGVLGTAGVIATLPGFGVPAAAAYLWWNRGSVTGPVSENLPKYNRRVTCECWGGRDTVIQDMIAQAMALVAARLGGNQRFEFFSSRMHELNILVARHDSYVRVECSQRWGLEDTFLGALAGGIPFLADGVPTPATALAGDLINAPSFTNIGLPNLSGDPVLSRAPADATNPSLGGNVGAAQEVTYIFFSALPQTDVAAGYQVSLTVNGAALTIVVTTTVGATFTTVANFILAQLQTVVPAGVATFSNPGADAYTGPFTQANSLAIRCQGTVVGVPLNITAQMRGPGTSSRCEVETIFSAGYNRVLNDRGTYLDRIVTQALQSTNQAAQTPQAGN